MVVVVVVVVVVFNKITSLGGDMHYECLLVGFSSCWLRVKAPKRGCAPMQWIYLFKLIFSSLFLSLLFLLLQVCSVPLKS